MSRSQLKADAALLFITLIWGATFVMVQDAVSAYPVFAFLAIRFSLAGAALLPFVGRARFPLRLPSLSASYSLWRSAIPGMLVGLALFAGYAFQTFGLRATTPAKAGFITGLAVVLVPLGEALFLRRMPRRAALLGVLLAAVGLALLSLQADFSVNRGDVLVFFCALAFAAHILLIGRYAPRWQALRLAVTQILTVALLSAVAARLWEWPVGLPAFGVWGAAAFTGLLATALAFFVQSRAQQATSPTHTALIFAAEPVFAGLFSFLLIGERLGPRQLVGSVLIVAGMIIAELRLPRRVPTEV
ncbi:MAG: DMT family transporter [Caldilineales bacterium]